MFNDLETFIVNIPCSFGSTSCNNHRRIADIVIAHDIDNAPSGSVVRVVVIGFVHFTMRVSEAVCKNPVIGGRGFRITAHG